MSSLQLSGPTYLPLINEAGSFAPVAIQRTSPGAPSVSWDERIEEDRWQLDWRVRCADC
jgi:hypothetical protein